MSEISRVKDDVLVIFSAHKVFDKMTKRVHIKIHLNALIGQVIFSLTKLSVCFVK